MLEGGSPIYLKNTSGILTARNQGDTADLIYRPVNVLRGITPTQTTWGTPPSSLSNITDGDVSTVTGQGSTNMGAAGNYGILIFDLGSSKRVLLGGRFGLWAANSQLCWVAAEGSDDNITYRSGCANAIAYMAAASASEVISDSLTAIIQARYIRLRFVVNGISNTANAKIYEVWAHEMGA